MAYRKSGRNLTYNLSSIRLTHPANYRDRPAAVIGIFCESCQKPTRFDLAVRFTHAMRADFDRAIAGLREAIDEGWRVSWPYPRDGSWYMLRQDWKLQSLPQDPEFIAMVEELEADIKAQRRWFEDNRDKPLF